MSEKHFCDVCRVQLTEDTWYNVELSVTGPTTFLGSRMRVPGVRDLDVCPTHYNDMIAQIAVVLPGPAIEPV